MTRTRVTDYDILADRYDRRYAQLDYAGVRDTLHSFLTPNASALEVGCGTGYWLAEMRSRVASIAGLELSGPMLRLALTKAPGAALVRGCAEALPFADATFDRIFAINALHHFTDRTHFFAESRRVLRPGGALLSIGKDPHRAADDWWVYDYFHETRTIDAGRYAPTRILRGELALAGFSSAESFEADRVESVRTAQQAFDAGAIDPAFTSQLALLTDEEFRAGVERIRSAQAARAAEGADLHLITDFRLFGTIGWV